MEAKYGKVSNDIPVCPFFRCPGFEDEFKVDGNNL